MDPPVDGKSAVVVRVTTTGQFYAYIRDLDQTLIFEISIQQRPPEVGSQLFIYETGKYRPVKEQERWSIEHTGIRLDSICEEEVAAVWTYVVLTPEHALRTPFSVHFGRVCNINVKKMEAGIVYKVLAINTACLDISRMMKSVADRVSKQNLQWGIMSAVTLNIKQVTDQEMIQQVEAAIRLVIPDFDLAYLRAHPEMVVSTRLHSRAVTRPQSPEREKKAAPPVPVPAPVPAPVQVPVLPPVVAQPAQPLRASEKTAAPRSRRGYYPPPEQEALLPAAFIRKKPMPPPTPSLAAPSKPLSPAKPHQPIANERIRAPPDEIVPFKLPSEFGTRVSTRPAAPPRAQGQPEEPAPLPSPTRRYVHESEAARMRRASPPAERTSDDEQYEFEGVVVKVAAQTGSPYAHKTIWCRRFNLVVCPQEKLNLVDETDEGSWVSFNVRFVREGDWRGAVHGYNLRHCKSPHQHPFLTAALGPEKLIRVKCSVDTRGPPGWVSPVIGEKKGVFCYTPFIDTVAMKMSEYKTLDKRGESKFEAIMYLRADIGIHDQYPWILDEFVINEEPLNMSSFLALSGYGPSGPHRSIHPTGNTHITVHPTGVNRDTERGVDMTMRMWREQEEAERRARERGDDVGIDNYWQDPVLHEMGGGDPLKEQVSRPYVQEAPMQTKATAKEPDDGRHYGLVISLDIRDTNGTLWNVLMKGRTTLLCVEIPVELGVQQGCWIRVRIDGPFLTGQAGRGKGAVVLAFDDLAPPNITTRFIPVFREYNKQGIVIAKCIGQVQRRGSVCSLFVDLLGSVQDTKNEIHMGMLDGIYVCAEVFLMSEVWSVAKVHTQIKHFRVGDRGHAVDKLIPDEAAFFPVVDSVQEMWRRGKVLDTPWDDLFQMQELKRQQAARVWAAEEQHDIDKAEKAFSDMEWEERKQREREQKEKEQREQREWEQRKKQEMELRRRSEEREEERRRQKEEEEQMKREEEEERARVKAEMEKQKKLEEEVLKRRAEMERKKREDEKEELAKMMLAELEEAEKRKKKVKQTEEESAQPRNIVPITKPVLGFFARAQRRSAAAGIEKTAEMAQPIRDAKVETAAPEVTAVPSAPIEEEAECEVFDKYIVEEAEEEEDPEIEFVEHNGGEIIEEMIEELSGGDAVEQQWEEEEREEMNEVKEDPVVEEVEEQQLNVSDDGVADLSHMSLRSEENENEEKEVIIEPKVEMRPYIPVVEPEQLDQPEPADQPAVDVEAVVPEAEPQQAVELLKEPLFTQYGEPQPDVVPQFRMRRLSSLCEADRPDETQPEHSLPVFVVANVRGAHALVWAQEEGMTAAAVTKEVAERAGIALDDLRIGDWLKVRFRLRRRMNTIGENERDLHERQSYSHIVTRVRRRCAPLLVQRIRRGFIEMLMDFDLSEPGVVERVIIDGKAKFYKIISTEGVYVLLPRSRLDEVCGEEFARTAQPTAAMRVRAWCCWSPRPKTNAAFELMHDNQLRQVRSDGSERVLSCERGEAAREARERDEVEEYKGSRKGYRHDSE